MPDPEAWVDLGHGIAWQWTSEAHTGIWLRLAEDCTPLIPFKAPEGHVVWTLESEDPLTISPSIQTTRAEGENWHGFIRDGRWEPC